MTVRPLRPATNRSLGGPLPHQQANWPRAPPQAPGPEGSPALIFNTYVSKVSCGISPGFPELFPTRGQITHVLLTRPPLYLGTEAPFLARLACVRHAASVDSEPGSNSRVLKRFRAYITPPKREGIIARISKGPEIFRLRDTIHSSS